MNEGSSGRGASGSADLAAGAAIGRALGRVRDLASLGRAALAAAVHGEGGGFERGWLLEWNARSGQLELTGVLERPSAGESLPEFLERCGGVTATPDAPALSVRPARLSGVVAEAWNPGAATRVGGEDGEMPWGSAAHPGAVALRRPGLPWALVVGTWASAPSVEQRRALEAIGAVSGVVAQSLEREQEASRRAHQAAALAQAVRALGATQNLAELLQLIARLAAQGTSARGSALWVRGAGALRLEVAHGSAGRRERAARALQALAEAVAEEGRPRVVERATEEMLLAPESAATVDSVAACPLRAYGQVVGVLVCYDRMAPGRGEAATFVAADVEFVAALGDVAGVAVDQAARFAELKAGEGQRRELAARLERLERLAWLGELAGRMGREARNPLASITAFANRAQRSLAEGDPAREYLEIVLRESERLERLLAEQSAYAAPEGTLRLESLNAVVQEALTGVAPGLVGRRVRLVKKLAPELPALLLDRDRIRRVVGNILESVLDSVGVGGRVRVESRQAGAAVLLEVAHDGPRGPGDLLEQLFVPFASQHPGGPAVGLGVAQQIVREHGGEIRVRSDGEWGTVFSLSLPVHENQDRRRSGPDRRRSRTDRRSPRPER